MKQVHLTLKTVVQNRRENRDRMKIEEKNIVRQISAFKASVIKKLDELTVWYPSVLLQKTNFLVDRRLS
jgi:hypothetical protein